MRKTKGDFYMLQKNKISVSEALEKLKNEDFDDGTLNNKQSISPRGQGSFVASAPNDVNAKIINKLLAISKALADEFGFEQKEVLEDMVKDLRLAGGAELIDVIKGDSPIEQMTAEMAQKAKEIGVDSNIAIQALLRMDERQCVDMFRQFLNAGGQISTKEKNIKQIGSKPEDMSFLESLRHRVLLDEGLEDIFSKYYANDFKRPMFDKIIRLDPTFNEADDKLGTYGKWLLNAVKQKRLTERDFARVNEVLFDFNERKRYITTPNGKDINTYKTLGEIRDALNSIELTANQKAKQARKAKHFADLGEDAEFILENDKYEVWSPKTYAASCKLGSGTTWCTASTSYEGHYTHYSTTGKLYVFIPKNGKTEDKYQAHVKDNRVTTFMDASDRPSIPFATFVVKNGLLDAVKASELKNVDAILDAENMERVQRGEPYMYAGGRVKAEFVPLVKYIKFVPEFTDTLIPGRAFSGCTELEKIIIPKTVTHIGSQAFRGCDKVKIYTPKHELVVYPADREFLQSRITYIKG